MGDSRGEQRPSAKISAAAYRSRSASKAHHLPIKRGIKLCCSPPTSSLLSLTSSPWGNHHLYMRFSPFFNLFSAPCHTDPRGLAARLGLPASLEAGCFSHPPHGNLPQDNFGQCLRCFPANLYHLIPTSIYSPFLTRSPACWSSPILCSPRSPVEKPSVHCWGRDCTSNTPARSRHCLPGN